MSYNTWDIAQQVRQWADLIGPDRRRVDEVRIEPVEYATQEGEVTNCRRKNRQSEAGNEEDQATAGISILIFCTGGISTHIESAKFLHAQTLSACVVDHSKPQTAVPSCR